MVYNSDHWKPDRNEYTCNGNEPGDVFGIHEVVCIPFVCVPFCLPAVLSFQAQSPVVYFQSHHDHAISRAAGTSKAQDTLGLFCDAGSRTIQLCFLLVSL